MVAKGSVTEEPTYSSRADRDGLPGDPVARTHARARLVLVLFLLFLGLAAVLRAPTFSNRVFNSDEAYLATAQATIRANLAHLEETLRDVDGVRLAVAPERGLACALDVSASGASAQEVMVALFARRVAVYPGDGLGESSAASTVRLNLSNPEPWVMAHVRAALGDAVAEAASGRWREPVAALFDGKGTDRAPP